jgi:hypothetical protein
MITIKTVRGSYQFQQCYPSTKWNNVCGVYLFVKDNLFGPTKILYVGRTTSFADRMPNHDRWAEAQAMGATGILAMSCSLIGAAAIERELIEAFNPPLNVQHRTIMGDYA